MQPCDYLQDLQSAWLALQKNRAGISDKMDTETVTVLFKMKVNL